LSAGGSFNASVGPPNHRTSFSSLGSLFLERVCGHLPSSRSCSKNRLSSPGEAFFSSQKCQHVRVSFRAPSRRDPFEFFPFAGQEADLSGITNFLRIIHCELKDPFFFDCCSRRERPFPLPLNIPPEKGPFVSPSLFFFEPSSREDRIQRCRFYFIKRSLRISRPSFIPFGILFSFLKFRSVLLLIPEVDTEFSLGGDHVYALCFPFRRRKREFFFFIPWA